MSETDPEGESTPYESGEESIDESGRNPTQQQIDEDAAQEGDAPVDKPWVIREGDST